MFQQQQKYDPPNKQQQQKKRSNDLHISFSKKEIQTDFFFFDNGQNENIL